MLLLYKADIKAVYFKPNLTLAIILDKAFTYDN